MATGSYRWVYGPVPSRRLGRSLGIDLVPFKTCTFDCIYCQLGRTTNKTVERKEYVPVDDLLTEVERKLAEGHPLDYISLAGSGEPTLHSGIGTIIRGIKGMTNVPVAVLTNGSLLWLNNVQEALLAADLLLPSLDAGDSAMLQLVNRPHGALSLEQIVNGLAAFTKRFRGEVWLEVLLLAGLTAKRSEAEKIATLIERIGPSRVQLNTASRPPAEEYALALTAGQLHSLKNLFPGQVDVISEQENGDSPASPFVSTTEEAILALLERRPCTPTGVAHGLGIHVTEAVKHLDRLLNGGRVTTVLLRKQLFYTAVGQ